MKTKRNPGKLVSWKGAGLVLGLMACAAVASAQTKENEKERVVELPPMVVEDAKIPPRWRYAALPGMEFLASCDDDTALQLIERVHRMTQQLDQFVPPSLRIRFSTPVSFVLFDEKSKLFNAEEVVADMQKSSVQKLAGKDRFGTEAVTLRSLPNFRFWDRDKLSVFFVMKEELMGGGPMTLTSGYVRYLLEARSPALPRWFVEGMMALYETAKLEAPPIYWFGSFGRSPVGTTAADNSVMIGPAMWVNADETKKMLNAGKATKPRLLDMKQIFAAPPPPNPDMMAAVKSREERDGFTKSDGVVVLAPMVVSGDAGPDLEERRREYQLWRSQAALFLRWALDKGGEKKRAALWKFVEQATEQAVTEAQFEAAFGLSYSGVTGALLTYFPDAIARSSSFSLVTPEVVPTPDPRTTRPEHGGTCSN